MVELISDIKGVKNQKANQFCRKWVETETERKVVDHREERERERDNDLPLHNSSLLVCIYFQ